MVARIPLASVALALALACGGSDHAGTGSVGAGDGGVASDAGTVAGAVSISLSQTDVRIPVGTTTAFAVTATMADGSRRDVTQEAQATSSYPQVATVAHGPGSQIQITAQSPGSATITVTLGTLTQTCAVTVSPR